MNETVLLPFRSFPTILANTNATTVYECPPSTLAQVTDIIVADDGGEARTITLTWTDDSASVTATLVFQGPVAVNSSFRLAWTGRLALDPGDTITATASAAGVHVTVLAIEYARSLARAR